MNTRLALVWAHVSLLKSFRARTELPALRKHWNIRVYSEGEDSPEGDGASFRPSLLRDRVSFTSALGRQPASPSPVPRVGITVAKAEFSSPQVLPHTWRPSSSVWHRKWLPFPSLPPSLMSSVIPGNRTVGESSLVKQGWSPLSTFSPHWDPQWPCVFKKLELLFFLLETRVWWLVCVCFVFFFPPLCLVNPTLPPPAAPPFLQNDLQQYHWPADVPPHFRFIDAVWK